MPTDDGTSLPGPRDARASGGPRHAAPRTPLRGRLKMPAGKVLAIAAMPTALLMGVGHTPTLALADDSKKDTNCATASDTPAESASPSATATPSGSGSSSAKPSASAKPSTPAVSSSPSAAPSSTPAAQSTPTPTASASSTASKAVSVARAATASPSASATGATVADKAQDVIGDIIGGITSVLTGGSASGSASATPTPSATATPSTTPSTVPSATAEPSASSAPSAKSTTAGRTSGKATGGKATGGTSSGKATGKAAGASNGAGSGTSTGKAATSPRAKAEQKIDEIVQAAKARALGRAGSASPSSSASAGSDALCATNTSALTAKSELAAGTMPDQSWTLHTTKLALHGAVFGGVVDVKTATGTKKVLKFTVNSIDIDDLDMSTIEYPGGQTFHVKGAPGSTSTMRNGPIVMYTEKLQGHLAALEGIPLPDLGEITLTPDSLPKFLFDLIGAVPIPLDMTLTKVKAVQAGQFGGTLTIPGMHLYNDNQPYDG